MKTKLLKLFRKEFDYFFEEYRFNREVLIFNKRNKNTYSFTVKFWSYNIDLVNHIVEYHGSKYSRLYYLWKREYKKREKRENLEYFNNRKNRK